MRQSSADIVRKLNPEQQERFIAALRQSERENVRALGDAWAAGRPPSTTPKLVTVRQPDGETQTYVLSAKANRGRHGRFRRALRHDGQVVGVKDFRLPGRFERDLQRRAQRIASLAQAGIIGADEARQLGFNEAKLTELVRRKRLTLMDVARVARDRGAVTPWVAHGKLTAEEGMELLFDRAFFTALRSSRDIPSDIADKMVGVRFSTLAAIDAEYETLRMVRSPLAETGRFAIRERLFVLSRAMGLDAFALAKLPMADTTRVAVARHVLAGLAVRLAAYHAVGVVHRDVKLENTLLDIGGTVEPCDAGLATRLNAEGMATQAVGTLQYAAPEMVAGHPYTQAVDVFSLGVAIAALATGRNLIQGEGDAAVVALRDLMQLRSGCALHPDTGACHLPALFARADMPHRVHYLRGVLQQWYALDASTATYVFTHMLTPDAGQRASMQDLQVRFPGQTAQAQSDARLTTDLVQQHTGAELHDECATMAAFATALRVQAWSRHTP